jgi:hypothetical protein
MGKAGPCGEEVFSVADSIEPINFGSQKASATERFYADLVSQNPAGVAGVMLSPACLKRFELEFFGCLL